MSVVDRAAFRRRLLLWGVPLLAVLAGTLVWALGGRSVETDNAYLKADLVTIYPEIDAQVTEVLVEENQVVTAGQPLLRLDRAAAAIDVERAAAHLASMQGDLDALRRQYAQRQGEHRSGDRFDAVVRAAAGGMEIVEAQVEARGLEPADVGQLLHQ
ncbi:MAG: biotin/lipoyl-binding protein, partial [Gammaproteobacteria bacterium]|nr:biotin/lipoyl-binding protein [Gammaproteobacteria bacterium]